MTRCGTCDATSNGQMTNIPIRVGRAFYPDPMRPWLDICSDCNGFQAQGIDDNLQEGEVGNLDLGWDE